MIYRYNVRHPLGYDLEVSFFVSDGLVGLCSAYWVGGLKVGVSHEEGNYEKFVELARKNKVKGTFASQAQEVLGEKFYPRLHEAIACAMDEQNEHVVLCSDHHLNKDVSFAGLAKKMGYDKLPAYRSRVTGNVCQVFMYNFTAAEKQDLGATDPTADYVDYEDDGAPLKDI